MTTTKSRGLGPVGVAKLEAVLRQLPEGADSGMVGRRAGYARVSASKGLGELAKAGRAVCFRGSYGRVVWFHIEHQAGFHAMRATHASTLAESTKNRLGTEERYARFLAFEDDPVHRTVPARLAPPLRPAGPASVWELAA